MKKGYKRKPFSKEHRRKIGEAHKGKKRIFTEEWKANMSKARKKDWANGRVWSSNPEKTKAIIGKKVSRENCTRWLGDDIVIHCIVCGKKRTIRPDIKNTAKFCSKKCQIKYIRGEHHHWTGHFEENNINWVGDAITYMGIHKRIFRKKGYPKYCEDCGKIGKRAGKGNYWNIDWSSDTHEYKTIEEFTGRCRSCHQRHDKFNFAKI